MYRYTVFSLFKPGKILYKSHTCKCKIINNKHIIHKKLISSYGRNYSNKTPDEPENSDEKNDRNLILNFDGKYKAFRDEDSTTIFDVNEEMEKIKLTDLNIEEKHTDPVIELNIAHGINGVFEIEDFVELLRRDKNIKQLFVASVPKEYNYIDYIVIVTGISPKHMKALALHVHKIYKSIKHKNDIVPLIEGENSKEWIAIDLGNIAFHIFDHQTRLKYDLETLWSVGSEYDDLFNTSNQPNLIDKYREFLKIYEPVE